IPEKWTQQIYIIQHIVHSKQPWARDRYKVVPQGTLDYSGYGNKIYAEQELQRVPKPPPDLPLPLPPALPPVPKSAQLPLPEVLFDTNQPKTTTKSGRKIKYNKIFENY